MNQKMGIEEFLTLAENHVILDVRTPQEYSHAHIPKAFSLPLFSDEERVLVGTDYARKGKKEAIKLGLTLIGPKMRSLIEEAEKHCKSSQTIGLYCWRGGMRSESMAWLLSFYGIPVKVLQGGYQSYRRFALSQFEKKFQLKILSGKTGSAKTLILQEIMKTGVQGIDLEELAGHKGSAFGSLGQPPQPSQEQFENHLALKLWKCNPDLPLWLEDESRKIGKVSLPKAFFEQMQQAPALEIEKPLEERIRYLIKDYGQFSKEQLTAALQNLKDRLGDENTRKASDLILQGDLEQACTLLLDYYDRGYELFRKKRKGPFSSIFLSGPPDKSQAQKVLKTEIPS